MSQTEGTINIDGVELTTLKYDYVEGSHGESRCAWCRVQGEFIGTFPHKPDCPFHTIKALQLALHRATEAIIVQPDSMRIVKRGNEFYEVPASKVDDFIEKVQDLRADDRQVENGLKGVSASAQLFGKVVWSGAFDYDSWHDDFLQRPRTRSAKKS